MTGRLEEGICQGDDNVSSEDREPIELPEDDDGEEYVPAVFARSDEEAEEFCELLNDHDIPAMIGTEIEESPPAGKQAMTRGVPVMVPDSMLDEASEIIADREDDEEFLIDEEGEELEEDEEEEEEFGFSGAGESEEAGLDEMDVFEEEDEEEDEDDDLMLGGEDDEDLY
jgi:hypothetical protein